MIRCGKLWKRQGDRKVGEEDNEIDLVRKEEKEKCKAGIKRGKE